MENMTLKSLPIGIQTFEKRHQFGRSADTDG